jgi:hypothetical protein
VSNLVVNLDAIPWFVVRGWGVGRSLFAYCSAESIAAQFAVGLTVLLNI